MKTAILFLLIVLVLLPAASAAGTVSLDNLIVAGVFRTSQTTVFVEKPDRSFGVKVNTMSTTLVVGDIVRVAGDMTVIDGQKVIAAPSELAKTGNTDVLPRPLAVTEKSMVEASNGRGCPISGLRVKTWGRVTMAPVRADPYFGYWYILVDDGTAVYNPQDRLIGYRVYYKESDFPDLSRDLAEGDFCVIQGIMESVGHTTIPALTNNLPIIWAEAVLKL